MFGSSTFASAPFADESGAVNAFIDSTGVSASGYVGEVVTGISTMPSSIVAEALLNSVIAQANADVPITGVEAASNQVGDVTVYTQKFVDLVGVEALGYIGTVTIYAAANVDLTGVSATGYLGTTEIDAQAIVNTTGVNATVSLGTVEIDAQALVQVFLADPANMSLGSVTTTGNAGISVTGVSATGYLGVETVFTEKFVYPTGVSATGSTGTVEIDGKGTVYVTGVNAACIVRAGRAVNVWGLVNTH